MMRVLLPTYTMRVTVKDQYRSNQSGSMGNASLDAVMGSCASSGGHKYFDSQKGKTGCDEAMAAVKDALSKAGIEVDVWLETFSHT